MTAKQTKKDTAAAELTVLDKLAAERLAHNANDSTALRFEEQKASDIVSPIDLANLMGIRPQMVYNYLSKGKFKTGDEERDAQINKYNNTQKKVIDLETAVIWATNYYGRKVEREQKAAEKIEAELKGEGVDA
jgi:predicted transcriptional regulator